MAHLAHNRFSGSLRGYLTVGPRPPGSLWGSERTFLIGTRESLMSTQAGRGPCSPEGQGRYPPRGWSSSGMHRSGGYTAHTSQLMSPHVGPEEEVEAAAFSSTSHPRSKYCTSLRDQTQVPSHSTDQCRVYLGVWGIFQVTFKTTLLCQTQEMVPAVESGSTCTDLIHSVLAPQLWHGGSKEQHGPHGTDTPLQKIMETLLCQRDVSHEEQSAVRE